MPLPPLIRTSTARNFLKELTDGFRIGEDAIDRLIALVTEQVKAVGLPALERAQKDDRTTMLGFGRTRGFSAEVMSIDKLQQAFIARIQPLIARDLGEVRREKMMHNLVDVLKKHYTKRQDWGNP